MITTCIYYSDVWKRNNSFILARRGTLVNFKNLLDAMAAKSTFPPESLAQSQASRAPQRHFMTGSIPSHQRRDNGFRLQQRDVSHL